MNNYKNETQIEKYKVIEKSNLPQEYISGAMPKFYAKLINNNFIQCSEPESTHIIKTPLGYDCINTNEHFFLWLANKVGINTAETTLVNQEYYYYLASQRFDKDKQLIHVSDLLIQETNKSINLNVLLDIVQNPNNFSFQNPKLEQQKLLNLIYYSNLIGNYDLHARNIAVLIDENNNASVSPAYDIVHTEYYNEVKRSYIKINDKVKNITKLDIIEGFIKHSTLSENEIKNSMAKIENKINKYLDQINNSFMDDEQIFFIKNRIIKNLENFKEKGQDKMNPHEPLEKLSKDEIIKPFEVILENTKLSEQTYPNRKHLRKEYLFLSDEHFLNCIKESIKNYQYNSLSSLITPQDEFYQTLSKNILSQYESIAISNSSKYIHPEQVELSDYKIITTPLQKNILSQIINNFNYMQFGSNISHLKKELEFIFKSEHKYQDQILPRFKEQYEDTEKIDIIQEAKEVTEQQKKQNIQKVLNYYLIMNL